MAEDEIKPALTPVRWADPPSPALLVDMDDWHGAAAVCLNGEPYGFTWADVEHLERARACMADDSLAAKRNESLIARIKALLPPEKP